MIIALTGATGQLGRLAIPALRTRAPGAEIVALARDPARAADLGVAVRAFDYDRPEGLAPALDGVDVLVLISSNDVGSRLSQHEAVIAAAKTAGVGRLIYTGLLKGDRSPLLLARDHVDTEAAIRAAGLPYTFLRNGWYIENHTGSLQGAIAAGALIGSAGAGRFSAAARADYAEAIAAVAGEGHDGQAYELAGDDSYSYAELAAEVSRQTGKALPYNDLPEEVYAGILTGFGFPDGFARILADADAKAAGGALQDDSRTLSRLIGRPTTPMAALVSQALA